MDTSHTPEYAQAESLDWSPVRHRLKFVLGGVTLASAWFDALELATHVTKLAPEPDAAFAEAATLVAKADGVVVPTHPIERPLSRITTGTSHIRYVTSVHNHYIVRLTGSADDYLKSLPRKHRQEIARKARKFGREAGGKIDFRVYRAPGEMQTFYDHARKISAKTYQEQLLDVGLPTSDDFHAAMLEGAARGEVWACLLFVDAEPVAYGYCEGRGDRLDYQYTGYDPKYGHLSPGNVLLYEMLQVLIEDGSFKAISLGSGEAQYKRAFANDVRRCATAFFFPRSARNLGLCWVHRGCGSAEDLVAAALDRLGLKQRVRKLMVSVYGRRGRKAL